MKKLILLLLFSFGFVFTPVVSAAVDDGSGGGGGSGSSSSGSDFTIPAWAIDAGLKLITNLDEVFYDFHLDNSDFAPVKSEDRVSASSNFMTSFLPLTWASGNLKIKVIEDGQFLDWMPQIDLVGSYGRIIALDVANQVMESTDAVTSVMNDYGYGITLTKAVSKETRLFAGFHHSAFSLDVSFAEGMFSSDDEDSGAGFGELTAGIEEGVSIARKDNIIITGITNEVSSRKTISAYIGYGFTYKKIFSRIVVSKRFWETGFNIYPEGLLVIHPFLGWHIEF